MILFFKSFIDTLRALSWIDLVFFAAVLFLIILIVSLIYFIMINNEEEPKEEKKEPEKDIVLKNNNISIFEDDKDPNEEGELLDLTAITKKLEEKKSDSINLTDYEQEQEEKAIISYEELLAKKSDYDIDYKEEENIGDITIKKVDLDNLKEKSINPKETKHSLKTISYEKEEAFLEALKKLQEQIS